MYDNRSLQWLLDHGLTLERDSHPARQLRHLTGKNKLTYVEVLHNPADTTDAWF
jgi:hypothetical protein